MAIDTKINPGSSENQSTCGETHCAEGLLYFKEDGNITLPLGFKLILFSLLTLECLVSELEHLNLWVRTAPHRTVNSSVTNRARAWLIARLTMLEHGYLARAWLFGQITMLEHG